MEVFQMFDFGRGSALDPAGKLIALPKNHSWVTGSYFWLYTSLSLTKNNVVFSLGQTGGHCYDESL